MSTEATRQFPVSNGRTSGRIKPTRNHRNRWKHALDLLEPRTLLSAKPGLFGNTIAILDKDTSPSAIDATDFGSLAVAGATVTRTFTIKNIGDATLNLIGVTRVTVSGTGAAAFKITSQPAVSSLAPDASTTFELQFDPTKAALQKATIQFATNAANVPFTFAVQGTGLAPVLTLLGGAAGNTAIANNTMVPKANNGTIFANVPLGEHSTRYFTVRNDGKAPLHFDETDVDITGNSAADYSAELSSDTIMPGDTATLVVTFTPGGSGVRTATIKLESDDPLRSNFTFAVQGGGIGVGFATSLGTGGIETGNALAVDGQGNVYIAGGMSGTAFLSNGKVLTSAGFVDVLVAKFDSTGKLIWAQRVGGTADDVAHGIALDADGNVLISGSFHNTVDFNPGSGAANFTSAGGTDAFLLKLEPKAGGFVWARAMGGGGNDVANAVAVGPGGRIAVAGSFSATADFNPAAAVSSLTSAGGSDAFVAVYDKGGVYQWAQRVGAGGDDSAHGVAVDASGNVYATGAVIGTADFDPGAGTANRTSNNGTADAFLWKLNGSGSFLWANVMGGDVGGDVGRGVALSGDRVTITGSYKGSGDFDPGAGTRVLNAPSTGTFVATYQIADGSMAWAQSLDGTSSVDGWGVATTADGEVMVFGEFRGTADMNPDAAETENLVALGLPDAFITKLDRDGAFVFAQSLDFATQAKARGITVDAQGRPIAVGFFQGTNIYNVGDGVVTLVGNGNTDAFIWKFLPPPAVSLTGQNIAIFDGADEPLESDGTDFGTINLNSGPLQRTFTITNTGFSALHITQVSLPAGFVLVDPISEWLAVGDSDDFVIALSDAKVGVFEGTVSFSTNNPSQSPFTFEIEGLVQNAVGSPSVGDAPNYRVIFSTPKSLYNVTIGTLNTSDENATSQTVTFEVINGVVALDLPNVSGTDRFFVTAASKLGGPVDVTTGHLDANGLVTINDALIAILDDQENLLPSVSLFKAVSGKLTAFTTAGILENPVSGEVTFLPGGKATLTDSDGDTYTVTLTGGGFVGIELEDGDQNNQGPLRRIALVNTTPKSALSITVKKGVAGDGVVTLGELTGASLKSFSAPAVDLIGAGMVFGGSVGTITVRDVLNQADIRVGGQANLKTTIKARLIGDGTVIDSDATIASLTALAVGRAEIIAPTLTKVTTSIAASVPGADGSFAANVTLAGVAGIATTLGTATIAGAIAGGYWLVQGNAGTITAASVSTLTLVVAGDITTKLEIKGNASDLNVFARNAKAITVKGALSESAIRTSGDIKSMSVGSISDSQVLAGVAPDVAALPASAGDFQNATASIATFTITGTASSLQRSILGAGRLGTVNIKTIDSANGGTDFGFAAFSVTSYARTGLAAIKNPVPGEYDAQGDFVLRVLEKA